MRWKQKNPAPAIFSPRPNFYAAKMRKTLGKRFLRRLLAGLMGSSGLSSSPGQRWTSILSRGKSNTPSRYMNSEFSFESYELVGFERLYFFPFKQEASHLHLVIIPQGYI